jgi:phosphoribosylaminoimidazolecarboxamide formyltransferase / IMP cyclohydrolase
MKIKKALISVSDKTDLYPLAEFLIKAGVEIISTGGTQSMLKACGIPTTSVESLTGNPEAFGGRMKSISFQIASGLLYRRGHESDELEATQYRIPKIDLVICNLYPFEEKTKMNSTLPDLIEEIDIGGPLMIRAAAKNFESVAVLTHPSQYQDFMDNFKDCSTTLSFRQKFAVKAFDLIAHYDVCIAEELGKRINLERDYKFLSLKKMQELRYGENPHQKSSVYKWVNAKSEGFSSMKIWQGKELSYNNFLDADGAWKLISEMNEAFSDLTVAAVIKHGNPCGLSVGENLLTTLTKAWKGDEVSSFGGIVALSSKVTPAIAEFFQDKFVEIVMAPDFSEGALEIFSRKKNVRLIQMNQKPTQDQEVTMRSVHGGVLWQEEDEAYEKWDECRLMTQEKFGEDKKDLVTFGIIACKYLKSNGIALVGQDKNYLNLVGAGMGLIALILFHS